jgi:hypothetical protein
MGELGVYSGFPSFSHLEIKLSLGKSGVEMAVLITRGLSRLNSLEDYIDTSIAGHAGSFSAKRFFEVGIAEGICFNFLDEQETDRMSKHSEPPISIDFIVYVNYRCLGEGKPTTLLPDRYLIRFCLTPPSIRVFHLSGLRRTEPEALVAAIAGLINMEAHAYGLEKDVVTIEWPQVP